jgi:hypothetical protein
MTEVGSADKSIGK